MKRQPEPPMPYGAWADCEERLSAMERAWQNGLLRVVIFYPATGRTAIRRGTKA